MAVKIPPPSRLNPHAALFIPTAFFLDVDDFSPQWWHLVHTHPAFPSFWLRSRYCIEAESESESEAESVSSSLSLQDMDEIDAVDDLYDFHSRLVDMEMQAEDALLHESGDDASSDDTLIHY